MPYGYTTDPELNRSTNRVMTLGVGLMVAIVLAFPIYLTFEPEAREDARTENLDSLATEGATVWELNCASCHGVDGEGVSAPALHSEQFLQSATNQQMASLIAVGIPGSAMPAFSQDHSGSLTSEQIKGVVTYVRSWEEGAPDVPNWRNPTPATTAPAPAETGAASGETDTASAAADPGAGQTDPASAETDPGSTGTSPASAGTAPAPSDSGAS